MAVQLTDRGAIRRHEGPGGWNVTLVECPDGLANVSTSHGVTRVFVADLPVAGSTESSAYAATACTPDGEALVLSREAPPALLVTAQGLRRAPEVPGSDESSRSASCGPRRSHSSDPGTSGARRSP